MMKRSGGTSRSPTERADRLARLSGGSNPLTSMSSSSGGLKKRSKFTSHAGVIDKRPKTLVKGSNMEVNDLLSGLSGSAPVPTETGEFKRGDLRKLAAREALLSRAGNTEIVPTFASVTQTSLANVPSQAKKSRTGRNQVLLEQGQAYASVAAFSNSSGATSSPISKTSFAQPSVDPFTLINAHLATVINSSGSHTASPTESTYVRPQKSKPSKPKPVQSQVHKPSKSSHKSGKRR